LKNIARFIAGFIERHVCSQVSSLQRDAAEYRAVFNGPPADMLSLVYECLTNGGHGLETNLRNGDVVRVPVLLQTDKLAPGEANPLVGESGLCDGNHLLVLRNEPRCPIFVGLVPPGQHSSLSQTSTRSDFGVSPSNSGAASISQWLNDGFIQLLVDEGLKAGAAKPSDAEVNQARSLVEAAVEAADVAEKHDTSRRAAWLVLARLWALKDSPLPFGSRVSLATGFPPSGDGSVDAKAKKGVLEELADRLEQVSWGGAAQQLQGRASGDRERASLTDAIGYLQRRCDVITALGRSISHFYGPAVTDGVGTPPDWWQDLTVERWAYLLEEDSPRKEAIRLECANPVIPNLRGFVPITSGKVVVRVMLPEGEESTEILVRRVVSGGVKNHREWRLSGKGILEIEDDVIPLHRTPVRYEAESADSSGGLKKGTLKVISLAGWEPGLVVYSRTALKGSLTKAQTKSRDKVDLESSLVLSGHGRHYLDVYLRPGVSIVANAKASDERGQVDNSREIPLVKIAESEFGLEVDATGDCFYQFQIKRPEKDGVDNFRVDLTGDDVAPDECSSQFELLIQRNTQRESARSMKVVRLNRQLRSADLQGWMLDPRNVRSSFYPLVFAPDYAVDWRTRDWGSPEDTVLSNGKFLNDPRPRVEEMKAPAEFLDAREQIASRIRGEEGNGLVESASLGEWAASDESFATLVERYVRTYSDWLAASPNEAAWCDLSMVTRFESDEVTLVQEPDAVLVSPLHPLRLAWQCLAQKSLFLAQRKLPCPAASVLDPHCVPDVLALPLRTASGGIKPTVFFAVECSSDYWGILWNTQRLDRIAEFAAKSPLDKELGLLVGGVSSGFSVSQVHRALTDVCELLVAKPVISVLVSSAAGQNNACNEGIISWSRKNYSVQERERSELRPFGAREIRILDDRKGFARPEDAEISNLAEDTGNAVQWYAGIDPSISPDLGIIAQLETSNAGHDQTKISSPMGVGGLIRSRIREQLKSASGQLLSESRAAGGAPISGDGLADNTAKAASLLENLSETPVGYVFAPSVHAITSTLQKAEFAAVSSSAVDPACFLGGWLEDTYLWDYELPSYSSRAGDNNGYYLLSSIKELDRETLRVVLSKLPDCKGISDEKLDQIVLEVARRGIPTVRGLSGGDSSASGDLGLFVATRVLQDTFQVSAEARNSLFPVWTEAGEDAEIVLVIPIDPFQGYLDDLGRAIKKNTMHRPDLLVAALRVSATSVSCKLTPVEVKYRGGPGQMPVSGRIEALGQAKSFSALVNGLLGTFSEDAEMLLWKLAFQHLLISMLGYGFRVYSQQVVVSGRSTRWAELHARVTEAILSSEMGLSVDERGRLIVIDGTQLSAPRDIDGDGFSETIELSQADAAAIVRGDGQLIYDAVRLKVGDWGMFPKESRIASARTISIGPRDPSADAGLGISQSAPSRRPEEAPGIGAVGAEKPGESGEAPAPSNKDESGTSGTSPRTDQAGIDLLIGDSMDGFEEVVRRLNVGDTALNQLNMGVVGDLGTGKTQLLKSLIYQFSQGAPENRGVRPKILIFDYKKDYSSDDFVAATGARVVKPWHLPINLFDVSGSSQSIAPWLERFKFFADVLDKIYPGVGPVQRQNLKKAVRDAYDQAEGTGQAPTIYDIHANYQAVLAGKVDSLSAIIDDFVDMELFTREPTSLESFDAFLDGVVVISLNELGQDDRTKNMLVAIMLNVFYEHMLRIPKRPFLGAAGNMRVVDSMLLVDEADNIMRYEFDVLRKILLQGREFGVGVVLASQYLSHFKAGATDYRQPLLSWFVHKVPNVTPQELSALGLTGQTTLAQFADRIKSLGLHECLYKTHDVAGEFVKGLPFYKLRQG
jgi:DNA phosphorothioation-dependent restriction protein DptH